MKAIECKKTSHSRIVATDNDGNRTVYHIDGNDQMEEAYDNAARKLCAKMHWTGNAHKGWLGDGRRVYVWEDHRGALTF
jgi:hypothetical protein